MPDAQAEAKRAAEIHARVDQTLMRQAALLQAGLPTVEETPAAAPYRHAPPPPRWQRTRYLVSAPPFASAERGAVLPILNESARTKVAVLGAKIAYFEARRSEARSSGRPLAAAALSSVIIAGHVMKASWDMLSALSGKDSGENILKTVFYQPAALFEYKKRQATLPAPSAEPLAYAEGAALNLVFLTVEALPGIRLAKEEVRTAHKVLVHDSRDAMHRLEDSERELDEALRKAREAPAGSHEQAVHHVEAAEARARFEMERVELDAARRRMVEHHMAYTLDDEFHGRVEAHPLTAREIDAINARFVSEGGSAPFHSEVPLYQVSVTKPLELCRTHRAADLSALRAVRSANGDWFVPCHTLEHIDQKHLRDLLALPDTNATDYIARYEVPAGTKFYVGAAGPIRGETSSRVERMYTDAEGAAVGGGGNGGKLQFFLDPHINAPAITGTDAAAKAALRESQARVRSRIVYKDSSEVPASLP